MFKIKTLLDEAVHLLFQFLLARLKFSLAGQTSSGGIFRCCNLNFCQLSGHLAQLFPQTGQAFIEFTECRAIAEFGFTGRQGEHMVAVENTPDTHNMVVCTLCSCYPWTVLGLPPVWYKSAPYRSRAVRDPRGVLAEFGVTLPDETNIKVWDSTAEVRYLVVPMRPEGTEGWSEEKLAELVVRDSMIGTALALDPAKLEDAA